MRTSKHVAAGVGFSALLLAAGACANRPEAYEGSPTRGQMITHFDLAVDARGHAIQGEVDAFRRASEELADLDPTRDLPAEVILQLGPMRWEAREGGRASSAAEAARAAAEIARTCGDCHQANSVGLAERFTLGGPPPPGSTGRHMAGLAWASRLLWDGLIGPSDRTWYTGAEGLIELGALPEGLEASLPTDVVEGASERLRELGRAATSMDDSQSRVELLAEVWEECAACHTSR